MNLDKLRRKLRTTEIELTEMKERLRASEKRGAELDKQKRSFESKMAQAVNILLQDGVTLSSNWDNYGEPGY